MDPAGNVFITDGENNRVRRIDDATGTIVTVAGTGAGFERGYLVAAAVAAAAAVLAGLLIPGGRVERHAGVAH